MLSVEASEHMSFEILLSYAIPYYSTHIRLEYSGVVSTMTSAANASISFPATDPVESLHPIHTGLNKVTEDFDRSMITSH
jgi:hypothetical protein